jgi:GT2 family glycosyltransferase
VRERWPAVELVELPRNAGFAAAANRGARHGRGELLLFLNSDALVPAGALDRLVADLRSDTRSAAVGPRLVDEAGRPELSFGSMVSPWSELRRKLLLGLLRLGLPAARSWVESATRRPRVVDWVSGACLLVRRDAALQAGLFDERLELYLEDVDLCAALRRLGWRVRFVPEVEVVHLRGRSRAAAPGAAELLYRRSQLAFYEKHHRRWLPVLRAYLRLRGRLPDQLRARHSGDGAARPPGERE